MPPHAQHRSHHGVTKALKSAAILQKMDGRLLNLGMFHIVSYQSFIFQNFHMCQNLIPEIVGH